jgi:hypothetical protein
VFLHHKGAVLKAEGRAMDLHLAPTDSVTLAVFLEEEMASLTVTEAIDRVKLVQAAQHDDGGKV